jgi:hypothetical protein
LNVDTGATNPNWPVDVNATATYNGMTFTSLWQNERAALGLVNGVVYVPYSGHLGDCEDYHGWVVGVPINNPSSVMAWATTALKGGIWGHGGVASDGTNMFVVTGNTSGTGGTWGGGEAIIRLQAGPIFSGNPTDYWAPINWHDLDNGDIDLGGCSAVLIDVPGATPSQLALALGKDGNAYLLNRNNLGGITAPVASANVDGVIRGQAAATYHTGQGTYFVFRAGSSAVSAYKITATNPPTIVPAWSLSQSGQGSPWVTTTGGTNNAIVWVVGSEGGDQRLHGYNGDTGAVVYAGGGPNELMANTRKWNTRYRHSGPDLLRRRQQSLCLYRTRRDAYAYTYCDAHTNSNSDTYTYANGNTYTYPDAWRDHAQCAWAQGAGQAHGRSLLERVECSQYRHLP